MTPAGILKAFGTRLATLTNAPPINWPNEDEVIARPALQVTRVPISTFDDTVDGIGSIDTGQFTINVLTEAGRYTTEADTIIANLKTLFKKGTRMVEAGDGVLLINRPPEEAGSGFRNGQDWVQPVRISYLTENL